MEFGLPLTAPGLSGYGLTQALKSELSSFVLVVRRPDGSDIEEGSLTRENGLSKRRRAREMAIQMLYQSDLGQESCDRVLNDFKPGDYLSEESDETSAESQRAVFTADSSVRNAAELDSALEYAKTLVRGTLEHLEHIDKLIRQQAEHWRLERMPPVDRNILRLAVYEFLCETDVPKLVILDEAIELAKEFGTEQSGRFVNGVLDGILKSHSLPGSLT